MNKEAGSAKEIIEQMVKQSGITKKLAAAILHNITEIIEEGLKKDGEVRVKGLGTFRLRWTRGKMGRNPKTGERVEIPSHNRVVFLPEQTFKEYINRDNRLLGYKIIPSADQVPPIVETTPEPEIIEQYQYQEQYQLPPEAEPFPGPEPENVAEPEIETEPETPTRKRHIHWIIPLAASVIIILSLVFYFRNFYQVGDQRSAVSSQQPAVISQQSEVGSQQPAVGSQQVAEPIQKSEISNPKPELNTPARTTEVVQSGGQHSTLNTITEGNHLFKLAREIYGNPYLWVLIYKENLDKITDPDMVVSGRELIIPALEGKPDQLTKNDSLAVSEGYHLVYEFYQVKDETKARDFALAMKRYKPK
jgi:nucleoid DNA-binding protein/nucleoid-associated protein YgaU